MLGSLCEVVRMEETGWGVSMGVETERKEMARAKPDTETEEDGDTNKIAVDAGGCLRRSKQSQ